VYADTHSALAVRLAREEGSAMGKIGGSLRCLRVFGQPREVCSSVSRSCWGLCRERGFEVGSEERTDVLQGLDFELAVLKLELSMKATAAREGKQLVRGFGTRNSHDKYWYYDVWIEGEVEMDGDGSRKVVEV